MVNARADPHMTPGAAAQFDRDDKSLDVFARTVNCTGVSLDIVLLAMAVADVFGRSVLNVSLALALVSWPV